MHTSSVKSAGQPERRTWHPVSSGIITIEFPSALLALLTSTVQQSRTSSHESKLTPLWLSLSKSWWLSWEFTCLLLKVTSNTLILLGNKDLGTRLVCGLKEGNQKETCASAVAPSVQFCYKSPLAVLSVCKWPDKALMQLSELVGSCSSRSDPSEDVLLCSWSGFPCQEWHVQLLQGCVCSWCAHKQICVGSEGQGKWSAAWGLPGVHPAFVWVRGGSAEPPGVQRAGCNGSEKEHIQPEEIASGSLLFCRPAH